MFASARTLWRFSPPFPRPTDRYQGYAESPEKKEGKATEKKPFSFTSFLSAVVQKREEGEKRVRQEKKDNFQKGRRVGTQQALFLWEADRRAHCIPNSMPAR